MKETDTTNCTSRKDRIPFFSGLGSELMKDLWWDNQETYNKEKERKKERESDE